MKRLVLGLSLLLALACKAQAPAPAPVVVNPAPPPDLKLKIDVPKPPPTIEEQIASLKIELTTARTDFENGVKQLQAVEDSRKQFLTDVEAAVRQATAPVGRLEVSIKEAQAEVEELKKMHQAFEKEYMEKLGALETRQSALLQQQQAANSQRYDELKEQLRRNTLLVEQKPRFSEIAEEKANLALYALNEIDGAKVNKKFGFFGGKPLLSPETQARITSKLRGLEQQQQRGNTINIR